MSLCLVFSIGMTSLRSGMVTQRPRICWGGTAVTSRPLRSFPQAPFCTSNLSQTMPTRGQGFRCAMKSLRQVSVCYPAGCSSSETMRCQSLVCCLRISPVCFKQEFSVLALVLTQHLQHGESSCGSIEPVKEAGFLCRCNCLS